MVLLKFPYKIPSMSAPQFDEIYKVHMKAINSFAIKLTRNKMDADDLVQDAAIKAFRKYNSYRNGESFKNWSFTIVKNTFINNYNSRKKQNIVQLPIEDIQDIFHYMPQENSRFSQEKKLKFVENCIEDLSSKSKTPFKLYIEGHTYKEISKCLNIPIGTVKSRINFARTKLKQSYMDAEKIMR